MTVKLCSKISLTNASVCVCARASIEIRVTSNKLFISYHHDIKLRIFRRLSSYKTSNDSVQNISLEENIKSWWSVYLCGITFITGFTNVNYFLSRLKSLMDG
jgi:hypothetical protein